MLKLELNEECGLQCPCTMNACVHAHALLYCNANHRVTALEESLMTATTAKNAAIAQVGDLAWFVSCDVFWGLEWWLELHGLLA